MADHLVQLTLENMIYKFKVSTEGCHNVAGFLKAIRASSQLPIGEGIMTLFQTDGTTEIDPETPVTELREIPSKPMVVTVAKLPVRAPITSSLKKFNYQGLGVEASCRKFLDAIANKLAMYYNFNWAQEDYPTFGDVLFAYQKDEWSHKFEYQTEEERRDEPAAPVPIRSVRLPDIFNADEWVKLQEWELKTNKRIYNAHLLSTSTGKPLVIVPHPDYNEETIKFLKTMSVKGQLFHDESRLQVRDEDGSYTT